MSNIVQFKKIADEISTREDGTEVISVVGAARLTGVSAEAVRQSLRSVNQKPNKLAKKLMEEGFSSVNLSAMHREGVTDEAMVVIARYYGYQAGQFCKPKAKRLSEQFDKLGSKAVFHQLKGATAEQQKPVAIADEITIREDGVAIVSVRGAARLAGVHESTLREHFSSACPSAGLSLSRLAEMITNKGFEGAGINQFSEQGIPDIALGEILKYYAYEAGARCTEEAKRTLSFMDEFNVRVWCYSMKGMVEVKSPTQQQQPQLPEPQPEPQIPPTPELEVLPPQQQPEVVTSVEKARQVHGVVADLLKNVQLGQTPQEDNVLKAQVAVSAIQAHCPELANALNPVKDALANTTAPEDVTYFTPTVLGERLGMSARAFNKRLKQMGLQVENDNPTKGESAWLPTEAGKAFSVMDVGSDNRLVWSVRVLELFDRVLELFDGAATA
ncbi:hypothetical protein D0962_04240 [Leptolyngbyaceae cyanobacterium CCMR0082]|uniref:Uncharacterized protein n=1 Tax=Adonisia turfae CCMR0082 TaxID=2304604 RepID=A0A6M0S187_9CYAN|nr:hypothetical protein [Adonisia turfae]NEZ61990.1 hypothetical protein [Adonisia turfae CCMR0082]